MKRLAVAAVLLSVVIAVCITGSVTVASIQRHADGILTECEAAINNGDGAEAADYAAELEKYWRCNRTALSVFINHGRYEEAALAISKIPVQLSGEDIADALPDCAEARRLLSEIAAEQQLRADHIF